MIALLIFNVNYLNFKVPTIFVKYVSLLLKVLLNVNISGKKIQIMITEYFSLC